MSDVAEEIGKKQGGWYDYAKVNCFAGNRWVGVPYFIVSWAVTYREDWFKEAGLEYPKTWDDFRKVGRAMKAKGKPFGQAFGHSINDPNAWCLSRSIWMWGGMEVDKDGRTVVLNSKTTVDALKFTLALWKDCLDEGGLAWDDSNNNRAFLSQEISLTGNAPSIYVAARQKFPDVYKGTNHGHYPPGPAGRFYWLPVLQQLRDEVLEEPEDGQGLHPLLHGPAPVRQYFEVMDTFGIPGTKVYRDSPLWRKDPKHGGVPGDPAVRPPGGLRGSTRPQGHRGPEQVHHGRHVRQEPCKECRPRTP